MNAGGILQCMRNRRVTRDFSENEITREQLLQILEAGRWAPSGGNRRLHRFIAVLDPTTIRCVRAVAPGMLGRPKALVIICIDWAKVDRVGFKRHNPGVYIDTGTAGQNMLLAAEALGLGAGPVTSFSQTAVRRILDLPEWLTPEMAICLGYRAAAGRSFRTLPERPTKLKDLAIWERFSG